MVNDTYGHDIGDEILKITANTLTHSLRKSDIHARMGGEEFAILLINTDIKGAKLFSEKLRSTVENMTYVKEKIKINITASIGITVLKEEDESIYEIFKRADQALYMAKNGGRNRVTIKL